MTLAKFCYNVCQSPVLLSSSSKLTQCRNKKMKFMSCFLIYVTVEIGVQIVLVRVNHPISPLSGEDSQTWLPLDMLNKRFPITAFIFQRIN